MPVRVMARLPMVSLLAATVLADSAPPSIRVRSPARRQSASVVVPDTTIRPGLIWLVPAFTTAAGSAARASTVPSAVPETVIEPASAVPAISFAALRLVMWALVMMALRICAERVITSPVVTLSEVTAPSTSSSPPFRSRTMGAAKRIGTVVAELSAMKSKAPATVPAGTVTLMAKGAVTTGSASLRVAMIVDPISVPSRS